MTALMSEDLMKAIDKANEAYNKMTPSEQKAMWEAQRLSFVRSEIGFGSDQDEAAYRDAQARGDVVRMAELTLESEERERKVEQYMRRKP